ncbi:MAG: PDZ domain-containing protein, partial [Planctomycetes bacterium]|nr:PDZ domain-containing protein [Planctomycetota bacterium]
AGLRGIRQTPEGDIVPGDIIEQIDGQAVGSIDELLNALEKRQKGQTVKVTILRDGRNQTVEVVLQ